MSFLVFLKGVSKFMREHIVLTSKNSSSLLSKSNLNFDYHSFQKSLSQSLLLTTNLKKFLRIRKNKNK